MQLLLKGACKKCILLNVHRFYSSAKKMEPSYAVAVCQMTSTNDKVANLNSVKRLIGEAVQKNAKVIFFPEASDYIATSKTENKQLAENLEGPLVQEYKNLAKTNNVWLSIGGMHEAFKEGDEVKMHNCHVLINDKGEISSVYRKLHLFDVTIPEKNINLKESDYIAGGKEILKPVETPVGLIGLQICYDLRFPELSVLQRKKGAEILTFPSAFTNSTGQAHWEILLRSRAIENQCYVIAAAQYGEHNKKRISYGHAVIIDPWGKIIAECPKYTEGTPTNESVAVATINRSLVAKIRKEMPVINHRRDDLYNLSMIKTCTNLLTPESDAIFQNKQFSFAEKTIPGSTVFYMSEYCYAFTNIRCVVPGHVLVTPLRWAKRLKDLNPAEVNDMFQAAVKVQRAVEKKYGATSSTICVQDGKEAGQTVSQVHIHIMPRTTGDFARNDDIYLELAKHDRDQNPEPIRGIEEMSDEAAQLRKLVL